MIYLELTASDVMKIRFATDAVWETVASLHALRPRGRHTPHAELRNRLPSVVRFNLGLLLDLTADRAWLPRMLTPIPSTTQREPLDCIWRIAKTDTATVADDIEELRRRVPNSPASRMTPAELAERTADALSSYWCAVLASVWERVDALLNADLGARAMSLSRNGYGFVLRELHPGLVMHGDSSLLARVPGVDEYVRPAGVGPCFVPSVFRWPGLVVSKEPVVVSYPVPGAVRVWEEEARQDVDWLNALLGRSRATILMNLGVPRTTTSLASRLGFAPATVSAHLAWLTRTRLVSAHRDGRRVLYSRTELAESLLDHDSGQACEAG